MAYIGQTPSAVPLDGDDIADDIITLAKLATGTDGNIISYDASGNPVAIATGSNGQVAPLHLRLYLRGDSMALHLQQTQQL